MKILRLFDSLKFLRTIFVAVACAFFIFPAHAELRDDELPNGYKRLTDVVFDGNTYYETNQTLYGTDTLTVRLSNTKTTGQNVIGAYSGSGNSARNFSLFIYGNGSSSDAYLRHGTILSRPNYGTGARTLVIGPTGTSGFAENTTYSAETFETTSTFWIGGLPNSSSPKYTGNIVGNITVGDRLKYIPCERTSDGAIGYYETVNKVFLENQGSGTPTTSGYDASHMIEVSDNSIIPAGYTELEYLESTGTQYIDTNATLNTSTDDVEIVFQTVSDNIANANLNLFGARSTTTSNAYTLGVVNGGWRFGWGNSSPSFGTANTNKHTARIEHNNGVLKIDDTIIATSGNASITTPTTATLFAIQTNGNVHIYYGTFKIYSYKKWTNDILVQNFVPVRRDSDGVLGMYDLADSNPATAFHTNAGTGEFVAGEYKIKIATTKYNEAEFAPVETDLNAARTVINNLITQMQTNAVNVSKLAVEKQTRPNVDCPAGKNCLLVTDPTGAENWYEIAGADAAQSSSNVPDYFSFTTTALNAGDSMSFSLTPSGTFTVDWGDGSTPQVIERTNTTSETYSHSYATGGEKTVKISGRATGYSTAEMTSVLSVDQIAPYVISIDGSLGAIFPTLGNGAGQQPQFYYTFADTPITSIPAGLFSGITGAAPYMFYFTFYNTQITSIPENLFRGVTGAAEGMFSNTFQNAPITSIPENLFSGVTGAARNMFSSTFYDTQITSIPENLFRGVTGAADNMFSSTFVGTQITSIPENLFRGVTGAAPHMFNSTFGNTQITSIPSGLFSGITGADSNTFRLTFGDCPNLTGYIPESTFAGLIQNNSPDAGDFMLYIFARATGLATTCPQNTTEVSTPYKSTYWSTGNGNAVMCRPN